MTTFEKIVEAVKPFGYPYEPDVYRGTEAERWITYNYSDDYASEFADDEPAVVIATVQVHLFLPIREDFYKIKQQIRKALFAQGFTYPEITVLTENETIRHIIFECDIEEE